MDLYHLTRPENVDGILKGGILADEEGFVWATDSPFVTDILARHLGLAEYAIILIRDAEQKGVLGEDVVGGDTSQHFVSIRCDSVPASGLSSPGVFCTPVSPTVADYLMSHQRMGFTREQTDNQWAKTGRLFD